MEHLLDRNPTFLSCHHSFCQQCLQGLTNNCEVSCPICRAVTALPNNDITKLAMNFQLVQMMEREKESKQEGEQTSSSPKCVFCSKEQAKYKCRECYQFLCAQCKIKHNQMETFKNHIILELCQEHMEGISHVCMQCVQALCIKCIVLDHRDHEHQVEENNEGMGKVKSKLEKMNNKLKERTDMIQTNQQDIHIQKNDALKKVKELQNKRDAFVKQLEEIDQELVNANDKVKNCDDYLKMFNDLSDQCVGASKNVNELLQSPYEQQLLDFVKQERLLEQLLKETHNLQAENKLMLNENIEWLAKPLQQTEFTYLGKLKIKNPTSIKRIHSDLLVYSDNSTKRTVVFDNKGAVKNNFEQTRLGLKCVDVYNNHLHLAHEKQLTLFTNVNTRKRSWFEFFPKINEICKILVKNNNTVICTDYDEGKVYEYNTKDRTTKMVLQGLQFPTYISVDHTLDGTRYILTLDQQSVNIYDNIWHLLTTIRQGIRSPCDTAPCPGGFLLADHYTNKITLYSYTGDLVRTVLTEEDGLDHPASLTLQPPFIWVAEATRAVKRKIFHHSIGKIKCFQIFKVDD